MISEAIIQINIYHPEFSSQMIKKYFPDLVYSPFNKTEQTLIKKGETYKINYNSSTKPLVWFNKKSKSTKGILVDISTELEQISGLLFTPSSTRNTDDHSIDLITIDREFSPYDTQNEITDSLIDVTFELFNNTNKKFAENHEFTIGLVKNRNGPYKFIQNNYPDATIISYDTPKECLKALNKAKLVLLF